MTLTTRPTRRPTPHVARIPAPAATSPTHAPPAGVLGGAPDLVDPEAILSLQQTAGNAATTALLRGDAGTPFVQRDEPRKASDATRPANPAGGWTGADTSGGGWNAGERVIGRMRRIPIQGLSLGKQSERNAANKALTEEAAGGRAILVVPVGLDPTKPVDAMVHLHGYTETAGRPYAGWRQHKDTGEVRDVALDRVEAQIESLNEPQVIGILAQGGVRSQFGEGGDAYGLDAVAYARDVLAKSVTAGAWKVAPPLGRTVLSAHSGGGHTVKRALAGELDRRKRAKGDSAFAEVALFDAITGPGELATTTDWVLARLNADLTVLADSKRAATDKAAYLRTSTRFRGYYATYAKSYRRLEASICDWFKAHAAELGPYGEQLWTHYQIVDTGLGHEEVMRGSRRRDKKAAAAKGNIADALRALDNPTARRTMAAACGIRPAASGGGASVGGAGAGGTKAGAKAPAGASGGEPAISTGATPSPALDRAATATELPAATIAGWLINVAGMFGGEGIVVGQIARAGFTDVVELTDLVFAARHPELGGGRIPAGDVDLAAEWRAIRHEIVEPAIPRAPTGAGAATEADTATPDVTPPGVTPDALPTATPSGDDFMTNLTETTLELLTDAEQARFAAITWVDLDYPGSKLKVNDTSEANLAKWQANPAYVLFKIKETYYIRGSHQDDAQDMLDALAKVRPGGGERRANSTATAILTKKQFKTDSEAYDAYIESQLVDVPGDDVRMNKHASAKFVEMREAAKADGVALAIGNAFRERKVAEASAKKRDNKKAVASYSSHSLGLAMDLSLRTKKMGKRKTVSTAMTNVVDLLRAPAYKWMFMRGAEFGFYQFRMEPWHWEYNPKGFAETFWADTPTLRPEEPPPKPRKKRGG